MARRIAAGAAALVMGVAVAGCGAAYAPGSATSQNGQGPGAPVSAASPVAAAGGPCRSAFFPALQAAAKAKLPVDTEETAATQWHGLSAVTFQQMTDVAAEANALAAALASTSATGNPLTASPKGTGSPAWTFTVDGQTAHLHMEEKRLSGAALAEAHVFGPAWAGGSAQYQIAFPAGPLAGTPSLGAYLDQLAAAVDSGQADLTVVTGGRPQPAPTQYQAYWGPLDMAAIAAPGSNLALCGSWKVRTIYADQGGDGTLAPVTAQMADIGNGGFIGFAAGKFVVESLHSGVDASTWYAIPGVPVTSGQG